MASCDGNGLGKMASYDGNGEATTASSVLVAQHNMTIVTGKGTSIMKVRIFGVVSNPSLPPYPNFT